MPLPIQRVPKGLSDVLSIFGGQTPQQLAEQVVGELDLLQFYGLQQRSSLQAGNAAAVQGTAVTVSTPATSWGVLFALQGTVIKQAAMTELALWIAWQRGTPAITQVLAYGEAPRLGAAGAVFTVVFVPAYPVLLPPGSTFVANLTGLAGVANAVLGVQAEVGLLG